MLKHQEYIVGWRSGVDLFNDNRKFTSQVKGKTMRNYALAKTVFKVFSSV